MCGIFGMTGETLLANSGYLGGSHIRHRGPDSSGKWRDDDVQFEHQRLSIIDLSPLGNQPYLKDDRFVLVFNGEIFNYQELRKKLESKYRFDSNSDTEVLYYLLQEKGMAALDDLNGMFAFAFYDRREKKMFLARDRFGVKPLYYHFDGKSLLFSSEQKAITPLIDRRVNRESLAEYLAFKYVSGAKTLVKDVFELEPSHFIEFNTGTKSFSKKRWYALPAERTADSRELRDEVESLLHDAVKLRLISDVPVGIQLSGGVDSSIISKMVHDLAPNIGHAFSVTFPGTEHDELPYASKIAKKFRLKLHPIEFTSKEFLSIWEQAVHHNDEPINHPHTLPIYSLNREAKKFVTVLLSGEGADEAFLGYEHHQSLLKMESPEQVSEFGRVLTSSQLSQILAPDFKRRAGDETGDRKAFADHMKSTSRNWIHQYEFAHHLNTLLNRIDKMSMAHAMEIRTPFLDYRLVELAMKQRMSNLIDLDEGKYRKKPLLDLYEKFFNNGESKRKKVGFRVPFNEWLKTDGKLTAFVCDHVKKLENDADFNSSRISTLCDRIFKGNLDEASIREAWVLVNYSLWKKVFDGR